MHAATIQFECDKCGRPLRAKAGAAGKRIACPSCQRTTIVRPLAQEPPATSGFRIGWPLFVGAGVLVVLAAVAGIVVGSTIGKRPHAVAAEPTTPIAVAAVAAVPKSDPITSIPTSPIEKARPEKAKDSDAVVPPSVAKETVASGKSDPRLNGTWTLSKLYDKYVPGEKSFLFVSSHYKMTINGNEMSVETESNGKKKTSKSTFSVDLAKKPGVYLQPMLDGKIRAGIYELEGDTLRMCDQSDGKAPEAFYADPKDGKRRQILEFVRVKP